MANLQLMNVAQAGEKIIFVYAPCPPQQVADAAAALMHREGYRLEQGNLMNGVWGIGNKTMRILFGAFVKRFSFHIMIGPGLNGEVQLEFSKGMSGFSGGVIGIAKPNTEMNRMQQLLRGLY